MARTVFMAVTLLLFSACSHPPSAYDDAGQLVFGAPDGSNGTDGGDGTSMDGGDTGMDAGGSGVDAGSDGGFTTPTLLTVQQIVNTESARNQSIYVEVDSAVVVAAYDGRASTDAAIFYVQDADTAGPGIAVVRAKGESFAIPDVGAIVTVIGVADRRGGILGIASSKADGITISVTVDEASGGVAGGGAYSPAGTPISLGSTASYASTITNAVSSQVGNALQFAGPLSITNTGALTATNADGGTIDLGFEVTGGVVVYEDYLRGSGCLHPDGGALSLTNGVRGVWDRYSSPALVDAGEGDMPVLYLMECADVDP